MKPDEILYCRSFVDASEEEGMLAELLSALGFDFSSRRDAETGITVHTMYFKTVADADAAAEKLESFRDDWKAIGSGFGEIKSSELKKEDWAESWKIHFKPIVISRKLAVAPSWSGFSPEPGQTVVTLDPGMSFGTGQHATTKFCLARLDAFAAENDVKNMSMLDSGCGSGILAIAASKLGWGIVEAFDIDPDAVDIAKENASANGVANIAFSAASLIEFDRNGKKYDVIAANILSSALLAGKDKLLSMLKPGGTLILAGIMESEYAIVSKAFTDSGCSEFASVAEGGWRGGAFVRK